MQTKHTPGPWHPIEYGGYWCIRSEPYYDSGFDLTDEEETDQAEANAKLMAAAPDMLEILEYLKKDAEDFTQGVFIKRNSTLNKRIVEVIKKATE